MLALDGARLRRSLAMTKQDCSDRYQLPQPVLAQGDRSVGLLSGFEESAKGFEFGDAS